MFLGWLTFCPGPQMALNRASVMSERETEHIQGNFQVLHNEAANEVGRVHNTTRLTSYNPPRINGTPETVCEFRRAMVRVAKDFGKAALRKIWWLMLIGICSLNYAATF